MKKILRHLPETVSYIHQKYPKTVETALILGTGLNDIPSSLDKELEIPYKEIPYFRPSTAPSHKGKLLFATMVGKRIAIMQGRLHCYEGYSPLEVTYPLFALRKIGVQNLIITNAAGSLNKDFQLGDIVIITNHINLTGTNPLIGENDENLGPRYPSMHEPYHKRFIELIRNVAQKNKVIVKSGIYAGLLGPNLETAAECKMLRILGADMVGLSTVPEVIIGVYLQMKILGISIIANLSNLFHTQLHSQSKIERIAHNSQDKLKILIEGFLRNL
jgi:purine-nucleoside phosphorylase